MYEIGLIVFGIVLGVLIGIASVWDRRFAEGRAYGYSQYCEKMEGEDELARIRRLM